MQIMQYYNKLTGINYKSMHIEPGQILLDLVNIQTSNQNVHCLEGKWAFKSQLFEIGIFNT